LVNNVSGGCRFSGAPGRPPGRPRIRGKTEGMKPLASLAPAMPGASYLVFCHVFWASRGPPGSPGKPTYAGNIINQPGVDTKHFHIKKGCVFRGLRPCAADPGPPPSVLLINNHPRPPSGGSSQPLQVRWHCVGAGVVAARPFIAPQVSQKWPPRAAPLRHPNRIPLCAFACVSSWLHDENERFAP
jgi:hypothetical protein